MHFDALADTYGSARPPYPAALWERVRRTGLAAPGRRAADLGAGTGEATGPLLAQGLEVVAVEPGAHLAAALAARHPSAEVVVARAEEADLGCAAFDLAVAATSIHWMDLDVLLPRLHRALVPEGRFLVWRHVFGDPAARPTAFRDRVAQVVARRNTPPRAGDPEDVDATAARLSASGLFTVEDVEVYRWSVELDARQVHRLVSTFSDWTPDEVDEVASAVTDLGGRVLEHYLSWLIVGAPVSPGPPARPLRSGSRTEIWPCTARSRRGNQISAAARVSVSLPEDNRERRQGHRRHDHRHAPRGQDAPQPHRRSRDHRTDEAAEVVGTGIRLLRDRIRAHDARPWDPPARSVARHGH